MCINTPALLGLVVVADKPLRLAQVENVMRPINNKAI
jgi:hypothetical protein